MTFVDFAAAQLRKLAEAANQDEPGVWYSDPNMLAMRTSIPCVDADFICACTPTRIIALLDALAHASPPPAPKVGDGFVRVPRVLAGRIAAYFHDGVDDESRYLARQWRNLAAAPAPVVAEACPDGLLPDGIECPRCHGKRAPSGIDGGTWVHIGERSDTAPERDPRNAPQVGDVCHSMYGTWTVVAKNHDGSLRCHVKDESAYSDRETTVPIENWQFKLYSDERWLTHEQYAAEKEKGK